MIVPHFGVYYDPTTNIVTSIARIDYSETDSEDNVKRGLQNLCPPGQEVLFVPSHQGDQLEVILAGLGISLTAPPTTDGAT